MQIPAEILAYAEVVVDPQENTAHRRQTAKIVSGTERRWNSVKEMNEIEQTFAFVTVPECVEVPEHINDLPLYFELSAGWANHQDYAGCSICWPEG